MTGMDSQSQIQHEMDLYPASLNTCTTTLKLSITNLDQNYCRHFFENPPVTFTAIIGGTQRRTQVTMQESTLQVNWGHFVVADSTSFNGETMKIELEVNNVLTGETADWSIS